MTQRIELSAADMPLRDFIAGLAPIREPVELVLRGTAVARIVPPSELSDAEKQQILDEGWAVVDKTRARMKGVKSSVVRKAVDKAVRAVRHEKRRR
ncbi:MAG: hypothetical protein HYS13_16605 [Planctomycetia bacterium]|nr:hypothetical protein [Planctomycetia bacterium]